MKFRKLSLLMVRPWFRVLWYLGWFVALVVMNVVWELTFPTEPWTLWFWIRAGIIATVCQMVFLTGGRVLRTRGRNRLRAQRLDTDLEEKVV